LGERPKGGKHRNIKIEWVLRRKTRENCVLGHRGTRKAIAPSALENRARRGAIEDWEGERLRQSNQREKGMFQHSESTFKFEKGKNISYLSEEDTSTITRLVIRDSSKHRGRSTLLGDKGVSFLEYRHLEGKTGWGKEEVQIGKGRGKPRDQFPWRLDSNRPNM